jgi:glycosyltransferase involved in cell wall biosynthesis
MEGRKDTDLMAKKKRVGLLIPNLQSGGAERVLSLTSQLLSEAGYDVYFFIFDNTNISYHYSGTLIDLRIKTGGNIFSKIIVRIIRILKVSYYKKKYEIDTMISFLNSANVVNYYSFGDSQIILSCRGFGDYLENGTKYANMTRNNCSLIVQTERMKEDIVSKHNADPNKVYVLYNPYDIDKIVKLSISEVDDNILSFIKSHKTICTVGTFKKDKGFWHLLKAFKKVKEAIPNAGLLVIGHRGEMEEEIKKMANAIDDILFLGYQENPFKYISKCDLYVCSSIYEGFPNALVEAMACGIPVLSTDCSTGPREVLSKSSNINWLENDFCASDYGILVPEVDGIVDFNINNITKEEKIMANAIITTLSNSEILSKYSLLSRKRSKEFRQDFYLKKLVEIIK